VGSLRSIDLRIQFEGDALVRFREARTPVPAWDRSLSSVAAWIAWLDRGSATEDFGHVRYPITFDATRAWAEWRLLDTEPFLDGRRYALLLLRAALPFAVSGRIILTDALGPVELSRLGEYELKGGVVEYREPSETEQAIAYEAWCRQSCGASPTEGQTDPGMATDEDEIPF
jgi:hypothetical protein